MVQFRWSWDRHLTKQGIHLDIRGAFQEGPGRREEVIKYALGAFLALAGVILQWVQLTVFTRTQNGRD